MPPKRKKTRRTPARRPATARPGTAAPPDPRKIPGPESPLGVSPGWRPLTPPREEAEEKPLPVSMLRQMEAGFEKSLPHPKVSVVIPNHNGVDSLWHCLFALKTQSYHPHEILVVDNASTDASVSFVRSNYPQIRILECQENFGPSMACNLGVKTATGDLVALLSPEAVVTPEWLARMVRDFKEGWPQFGALGSLARSGDSPNAREEHQTLNLLGKPVEGFFTDPREVFFPERGAVLYPRFLAPEGPFDSDYFSGLEDLYLGWKLRLEKVRVARSKEAKVFLRKVEKNQDVPEWKAVFLQTRNRWLSLFLFYETANLAKIMPWIFAEALLSLLGSLGKGFSAFWGTLCAVGWVVLHPVLILQKRRVIQQKRKVRDGEVLRYLSGRLVKDGKGASAWLNLLSLSYCRLTGIPVLEWQE